MRKFYKRGSIEYYFGRESNNCAIGIQVHDERILIYFGIPWIFSLYLSYDRPNYRGSYDRELSLTLFEGLIHWNIWTPSMSWSSSTPKHRNGSFDIMDFIFGPAAYKRKIIEVREVLIPMPEKSYKAIIYFCQDTWTRPRSWLRPEVVTRIDAKIPEGIPIPGKGENSWDCGPDATYGVTCPAESIAAGVGKIVGSCLETRIRRGAPWGYSERDVVFIDEADEKDKPTADEFKSMVDRTKYNNERLDPTK